MILVQNQYSSEISNACCCSQQEVAMREDYVSNRTDVQKNATKLMKFLIVTAVETKQKKASVVRLFAHMRRREDGSYSI